MSYKELRKKISSILVFALLIGMLSPAMAFGAEAVKLKDIADSYAKTEIQALVDAGIVSGYEDGSFQPTKAMTRAELAKIIVLALGKKENPDKAASFTDVAKDSWYRGYVGALVESGITDGTSATTFSPDAKVTREELVVFFVRAMGLEETAKKIKADADLTDLAQVSSWAQAHVSLAYKVGFVQGIETSNGKISFNPKANAERQALARLAYEFKVNKATYVEKAQALAKTEEKPSTPGTGGTSGTVGGGGGGYYGGGSGGGSGSYSTVELLNLGGQTIPYDVTLGAGTYGPSDGKTTKITGTLTLNPGADGSVTLKNIEADNIVVLSGDSNSVHLLNVKVKVKLTVNASNQTVSVRIVAEGTTSISATDVTSKATIQNDTANGGAFGGITINPSSSNQRVDLKGNHSGEIKVAGSVALNVYGTVGTIKAEAAVTLNAAAGSSIGALQLNSANANVSLIGSGIVQNIVAAVAGAILDIADEANIQKLEINVKLNLKVNKDKIINIPIVVPPGTNLSDLIVNAANDLLVAVKFAADVTSLSIGYAKDENNTNVKTNVTLPANGVNGSTVTWESSNPSVISTTGVVTRPAVGQPDAVVTLTATIKLGSLVTTKEFKLTVKANTDVNPGLPGVVTGITYTATTNSITLNWNASANAVSYAVYMDGTKIGTVSTTTIKVENLGAGKSYSFVIYAINAAGNVSSPSATFTAVTKSEPAPTTGSVTGYVYGANNTPLNGATVTVSDTSNSVTTGNNGQFTLSNIPAGSITLNVSASNYTSVTSATYVVVAGATITVGPIILTAVPVSTVTLNVYNVFKSGNTAVTTGVYGPLTKDGGSYLINSDVNFGSNDYLVIQFSDAIGTDVLTGHINVNADKKVTLNGASVEAAVYGKTVSEATYLVFKPGTLNNGTYNLTVTGFTYTDGSGSTKDVKLVLPVKKQ